MNNVVCEEHEEPQKEEGQEDGEAMDRTDGGGRADTLTHGAYPARRTEEVLVPVFIDQSLQAAMDVRPPPASRGPPPALPELRLVLLGRKGAGKSAAGDTILGGAGGFESGRPTEECVRLQAEVEGRKVTVVDTPGWEWYYPLNSTPEWVRRETLRSVSLCPPGPHAVLLVVRARASVTDAYVEEMEEHLRPLGRGIWEHAMVLFTRGDELGLGTVEQRIAASGPALHRLLHQCRNRYHVLNNRCRGGDSAQVKELLRKLEEMVNGGVEHGSSHLEMDGGVLTGLEADGKRRARERRKKQRQMEEEVQRGTIRAAVMNEGPQGSELDAHRSFSKAARCLSEIRLVLLGERETGKSAAGNAILGNDGFFPVGVVTEECIRQQGEVSTRLVTVVDTPGWEAGVAGGTLERVKREIARSVALCPPGPHALLLALRVDTLVRAEHVRQHLELLGDGVWRHTVLLFTHGDQLREGVDIRQHIQGGGRDLRWLLEKCRGRHHIISSLNGAGRDGAGARGVTELLEKVEKMAAMNRCEAFSGLVQEVRDLSHQKNEKFNQRLKEMADKMIRQEAELKKMKEREMTSIGRFFDRKKKVKLPGRADVHREEEDDEDRRAGERKSDIGDLEERIRWLTEDRERELQDLSLENERIRVVLDQSRRERDEAALRLELKEREIGELRERSDEQQMKILDLEGTGAENQRERSQREDAMRAQTQEWKREVEQLEETIETLKEEKMKCIERLNSFKAEMEQTREQERQKTLDILKQQEEDTEKKCEEIKSESQKETERRMQEKELEIKKIRSKHQEERSEFEKMMESLRVQGEQETKKIVKEVEREKEKHIKEVEERFEKEREEQEQEKQREIEQLEEKHSYKMQENRSENDKHIKEIHRNHQRDVRQQMEERERLIKALRAQHQEAMERMNERLKAMEAKTAEVKEETQRRIKEKEEELERRERQQLEKVREVELENQRESERMKRVHEEETEKQSQLIREMEEKYKNQIETMTLKNSREKEVLKDTCDQLVLQETEFKRQLEIMTGENKKCRESGEEKERENDRMELRMKEMNLQREEREKEVEDLKETLRQAEDKVIECLNDKRQVEEKLQERESEVQLLREMEEEREKDRRQMEKTLKEKDEEMKELRQRVKGKDEILQRREEEVEVILKRKEADEQENDREREREMEEWKQWLLNDTEVKLREKEVEIEVVRRQAEVRETRWREEQKKEEEKVTEEINRLIETLEKSRKEGRETQSLLEEKERQIQEQRKEIREKEGDTEKMKEKDEELREKDQELERLRRRESEAHHEVLLLKSTMELARSELKQLTRKMEAETSSLIREYEREVAKKNERIQLMAEERDAAIRRVEAERREKGGAATEKYRESQKRNEELQRENTSLKTQIENLRVRCDEGMTERQKSLKEMEALKEELQAEIERFKKRERERESQMPEQQNKKRAEGEQKLSRREKETEEREEVMKRSEEEPGTRGRDLDAKQEALQRKGLALASKDEEVKKLEVSPEIRQQELQGEQTQESQRRSEEEQEKKEKPRSDDDVSGERREVKEGGKEQERRTGEVQNGEVNGREEESSGRRELHAKQEELRERGLTLARREEEARHLEASLERRRQELQREEAVRRGAAVNLERMERELAGLLGALEGKQRELNSQGRDLQMKVRGLKDQGRELKDREHHLKGEERELLSWRSELQIQDRRVASTTQELERMGREVALLKEELRTKERNLKALFKKLGQWEESLRQREEELADGANGHGDGGSGAKEMGRLDVPGDGSPLMYQEVSERREKGQGSDRNERAEDAEDQTVKSSRSAAGRGPCQLETLAPEGNEAKRKRKAREEAQRAKVTPDFRLLSGSPDKTTQPAAMDMSVVVLGETWSSCSPGGVTTFGGEPSRPAGSTFSCWRGEVEGRRLAVAEPVGLRWRDGPDADESQQESVLDGASWCLPGPDVVLLLLPAFLTCTPKLRRAAKEHVELLGEGIWRRVLVVLTWAETLGERAEQHVLRNGELMALVERCGGGYHALANKKSDLKSLLEKMEKLSAEKNHEFSLKAENSS